MKMNISVTFSCLISYNIKVEGVDICLSDSLRENDSYTVYLVEVAEYPVVSTTSFFTNS